MRAKIFRTQGRPRVILKATRTSAKRYPLGRRYAKRYPLGQAHSQAAYAERYPLGQRQGNAPLHELRTYPDRGVSH